MVHTVQIWADLVCPFCWIGERRFRRALEASSRGAEVEVVYRSFRLTPGMPPTSLAAHLTRNYGDGASAIAGAQRMGATEGLTFDLSTAEMGDTLDAHRLLHLARARGLQAEVAHRFYQAYFSERASLFDPATLTALAVEAGLEAAAIAGVLESRRYADEVEHDQAEARALGVQGVPFFLFDGARAISGVHSVEAFQAAIERL